MSELIGGKEAKLAWASGKDVEYKSDEFDWICIGDSNVLGVFKRNDFNFRLKPQTITINGIEVPKPFEPKEGEKYYYISFEFEDGYSSWSELGCHLGGAWRTEEEIKQVVEALRSIFK